MTPMNADGIRKKISVLLWLACWLLAAQSGRAQSAQEEGRADLRVECNGSRFAKVTLTLPGPPDELAALQDAVRRSVHGSLRGERIRDRSDAWYLTARSGDLLYGSGLIAEGSVDP